MPDLIVVRDRPRGHVLLTGQGIRGRIPQAEHVDHDEWLQVGLSVIMSNPPTHTGATFVFRRGVEIPLCRHMTPLMKIRLRLYFQNNTTVWNSKYLVVCTTKTYFPPEQKTDTTAQLEKRFLQPTQSKCILGGLGNLKKLVPPG